MGNMESSKPNINHSFLFLWIASNIFALPILWGPLKLGTEIILFLGRLSNGKPIDFIEFISPLLLIPLGGAVMGAWLGLVQWLVLRQQFSQIHRWVLVSCIGGLVGTSLSWVTYIIVDNSLLAHSPKGSYPSEWLSFLVFGGILGLSLGISQWIVLRRLVNRAAWWIITLPTCFTLGLKIANWKLVPDAFVAQVCQMAQGLAAPFRGIVNNQVLVFFSLLGVAIALVGMGLLTGVLLNWLLRQHRKQIEEH